MCVCVCKSYNNTPSYSLYNMSFNKKITQHIHDND